MIRIHTVEGKRHDTDSLDYDTAVRLLTDPNAVFDIRATTCFDGKLGRTGRMAIPVRNVVNIDPGR